MFYKASVRYNRIISLSGSVIIAMGLILSSCGAKKGGEQNKTDQQNKMAISSLKDIEKKNEQIIQLLNGPANVEGSQSQGGQSQQSQQSQEPQQSGSSGQSGGGQQSGSPEQSGGGQQSGSPEQSGGPQESGSPEQSGGPQESGSSGQSGGGQQSESPEPSGGPQESGSSGQSGGAQQSGSPEQSMEPIETPSAQQISQQIDEQKWLQVNQNILDMHKLFNDYMPSALKMSVDPAISNGATASLNKLTNDAGDKKYMDVLVEANNLYKYICNFYALHQDKAASVKLDIYYARSIILGAMISDWKTADSALKELKTSWQAQKTGLSEKQKDSVAKLDFSVNEVEKVLSEKNQSLVEIKGKIMMQNLAELEKSMEE